MKRITYKRLRYLYSEIDDLFNIFLDQSLSLMSEKELERCFNENSEVDMDYIELNVINKNVSLRILYDASTLLEKMKKLYNKDKEQKDEK